MREHQIVIRLNPQQFDQVQRLARSSGAKSAGAFIRQHLMSSLKLDVGDASDAATANWQVIAGQIRRLHRELQLFIAESASLNEESDGVQYLVEETEEALLEEEIDLRTEEVERVAPAADGPDDAVEELADRAFAISPRLGAIDPLQDLLEDALLNPSDEDEEEDQRYDERDVIGAATDDETADDAQKSEAEDSAPEPKVETRFSNPADDEDSGGFSNPPPVSGGPPPRRRRT